VRPLPESWIRKVAADVDVALLKFSVRIVAAQAAGAVDVLPGVYKHPDDCVEAGAGGPFYSVSHRHGRSVVTWLEALGWVAIKGVGWIPGPVPVLPSPKDPELVFGLYDAAAARRELAVSERLHELGIPCARVLGYALFADADLPRNLRAIVQTRFRTGALVEPAFLYTQSLSPLRVTDLAYLDDNRRNEALRHMSQSFGCDCTHLVRAFMGTLGRTIGVYHRHDCVNDTLEASNVTLMGEITDFEWFSVPGVPLPDGTEPDMLVERQQKELLYAAEIGQELGALSGTRVSLQSTLRWCVEEYAAQQPKDAVLRWAEALVS
jgi:hypothetical protein